MGTPSIDTWWHELTTDDDPPMRVLVRLGTHPTRGTVCLGVAFDGLGHEVTARMLRTAPLGKIVGTAAANATGQAKHRAERQRPLDHTGRGDAFYEQLADDYREACRVAPHAPVQWLSKQTHRTESLAALRWHVGEARRRKILGPALPGRAGEQHQPPTGSKGAD
ncbi:MAG: hypothetical protein AAGA93_20805 [Actinomycetota bacterium]